MAEIENINESWNNHGFPEVENFIKGQLRTSGKKVALESSGSRFRVNLLDEDDNVLSNSNYISTTAENTMALSFIDANQYVKLGDQISVQYFYQVVNSNGDDAQTPATATIVVKYNNTIKTTIVQNISSNSTNTVNLTDFISTGRNAIEITVETADGEFTRTIYGYINAINLSLYSTFDPKYRYIKGNNLNINISLISTSGTKTIEWYVDQEKIDQMTTTSGSYSGSISIPTNRLNSGTHSIQIRAYFDNAGTFVYSNSICFLVPIINSNSTDRQYGLGTRFDYPDGRIFGQEDNITVEAGQYAQFSLDYYVYDTAANTVNLYIEGSQVAKSTGETNEVITYSDKLYESGTKEISIYSGNNTLVYSFLMNVVSAGIDVSEPENAEVILTALNKSNSREDRNRWLYNGVNFAEFNNFNWTSDGWQSDSLLVRGNASVNILINPFKSPEDYAPDNAITLIFKIKVQTVLDFDHPIISCIYNSTGIDITPQLARMRTSNGNSVSRQFASGQEYEIGFVSHPADNGSDDKMVYLYINGTIVAGTRRAGSDVENIYQAVPEYVSITGQYADVYIYDILFYRRALTANEMTDLYLLHINNADTFIEEYNNNNVLDNGGSVTVSSVPDNIPYIILTGRSTDAQGTASTVEIAMRGSTSKPLPRYDIDEILFVDQQHPAKNFKIVGGCIRLQGTTTLIYPVKNLRFYSKNQKKQKALLYLGCDASGNGGTLQSSHKYSFKSGSETVSGKPAAPVSCFVLKADCSDSSSTHNLGYATFINKVFHDAGILTPPQRYQNSNDYDIRIAIDGFPCYVFYRETIDSDPTFLGKFNMINDKGSEEVFGFADVKGYNSGSAGYRNIGKFKLIRVNKTTAYEFDPTKEEGSWDSLHSYAQDQFRNTYNNGALFNDGISQFDEDGEFIEYDDLGNHAYWDRYGFVFDDDSYAVFYDCEQDENGNVTWICDDGTVEGRNWHQHVNPTECWEFATNLSQVTDDQGNTQTEVDDTISSRVLFTVSDFTGRTQDGGYQWMTDFDLRYPDSDDLVEEYANGKTPTYLKKVCDWLAGIGDLRLNNVDYAIKKTKFMNEIENYFNINNVIAYFVATQLGMCVDQMAKNMMLCFFLDPLVESNQIMGKMRGFFQFYDNDTILGLRNDGYLIYNWDLDFDTYDTQQQQPAYAGYQSVLWGNINECYQDRIKSMYQTMRSTFTLQEFLDSFTKQIADKYCERIVNIDMYNKYINPVIQEGKDYLKSLHGTRTSHREWLIRNRIDLFDARYFAGDYQNTKMMLRGGKAQENSTPTGNVRIVTQRDWYYAVESESSIKEIKFCPANSVYTFTNEIPVGQSLSPQLYGLKYAKSLDLSDFIWNISASTFEGTYDYLQELIYSKYEDNHTCSTSGQFGNIGNHAPILKRMIVCNQIDWGNLDVSQCGFLEEIDARKSPGITSITFPNSDSLKILKLGSGLTTLTLRNKPNIETASIEGASNFTQNIIVENVSNPAAKMILQLLSLRYRDVSLSEVTGVSTININIGTESDPVQLGQTDVQALVKLAQDSTVSNKFVVGYCMIPNNEYYYRYQANILSQVFPNLIITGTPSVDRYSISGPSVILEGGSGEIYASEGADMTSNLRFELGSLNNQVFSPELGTPSYGTQILIDSNYPLSSRITIDNNGILTCGAPHENANWSLDVYVHAYPFYYTQQEIDADTYSAYPQHYHKVTIQAVNISALQINLDQYLTPSTVYRPSTTLIPSNNTKSTEVVTSWSADGVVINETTGQFTAPNLGNITIYAQIQMFGKTDADSRMIQQKECVVNSAVLSETVNVHVFKAFLAGLYDAQEAGVFNAFNIYLADEYEPGTQQIQNRRTSQFTATELQQINTAAFPYIMYYLAGNTYNANDFNDTSNRLNNETHSLSVLQYLTNVDSITCSSTTKFTSKLTDIVFPITSIFSADGNNVNLFNNCTELTSASFPNLTTISLGSTTSYEVNLFNGCSNLQSVQFPELTALLFEITGSDQSITNNMFKNCSRLSQVRMDKLERIVYSSPETAIGTKDNDNMFQDTTSMSAIYWPNLHTYQSIMDAQTSISMLLRCNVETFEIGSTSVVPLSINCPEGQSIFADASSLKTLITTKLYQVQGTSLFRGDVNLAYDTNELDLGSTSLYGIRGNSDQAFNGCQYVKKLIIPSRFNGFDSNAATGEFIKNSSLRIIDIRNKTGQDVYWGNMFKDSEARNLLFVHFPNNTLPSGGTLYNSNGIAIGTGRENCGLTGNYPVFVANMEAYKIVSPYSYIYDENNYNAIRQNYNMYVQQIINGVDEETAYDRYPCTWNRGVSLNRLFPYEMAKWMSRKVFMTNLTLESSGYSWPTINAMINEDKETTGIEYELDDITGNILNTITFATIYQDATVISSGEHNTLCRALIKANNAMIADELQGFLDPNNQYSYNDNASTVYVNDAPGTLSITASQLSNARYSNVALAYILEELRDSYYQSRIVEFPQLQYCITINEVPNYFGYSSIPSNTLHLKNITLPSSCLRISDYVFANSTLERVNNTYQVTYVGNYAFANTTALEEISFGQLTSLTTTDVFSGSAIETIQFNNLQTLTASALSGASQLVNFINDAELTQITSSYFPSGLQIQNYTFTNLANIASETFKDNTIIKSFIGPNVTAIGADAFKNCSSLETIKFDSLTNLSGSNRFTGCTSLLNITLGLTDENQLTNELNQAQNYVLDNITSISSTLFSTNSNIRTLKASSLQTIGANAFQNKSSFTSLDAPNLVTAWGAPFAETSLTGESFSGLENIKDLDLTGVNLSAIYNGGTYTVLDLQSDVLERLVIHPAYPFLTDTTSELGETTLNSFLNSDVLYYLDISNNDSSISQEGSDKGAYPIVKALMQSNIPITTLKLGKVYWNTQQTSKDESKRCEASVLHYILDLNTLDISGKIFAYEQYSLDFNYNIKALKRFQDIQPNFNNDYSSGLGIYLYNNYYYSGGVINIINEKYLLKSDSIYKCDLTCSVPERNDICRIQWNLSNSSYASINASTGEITTTLENYPKEYQINDTNRTSIRSKIDDYINSASITWTDTSEVSHTETFAIDSVNDTKEDIALKLNALHDLLLADSTLNVLPKLNVIYSTTLTDLPNWSNDNTNWVKLWRIKKALEDCYAYDYRSVITLSLYPYDQLSGTSSETPQEVISKIYTYKREAHLGDFVFADGTYSDEQFYYGYNIASQYPQKTVIAKCFYVNPENPEERLAVSVDRILQKYSSTSGSESMMWGIYPDNTYGYASGLFNGYTWNGSTYKTDTPIPNHSSYTPSNKSQYYFYNNFNNCRNEDLVDYSSNVSKYGPIVADVDGWVTKYRRQADQYNANDTVWDFNRMQTGSYPNLKAYSQLYSGNIVLNTLESSMIEGIASICKNYTTGSFYTNEITNYTQVEIPVGKWQTLAIIRHRNKLIEANLSNTQDFPFLVNPSTIKASGTQSETERLNEILYPMYLSDSHSYKHTLQFYYPAASYCYAYEPNVEGLAKQFKAHNWFLPSDGELIRIGQLYGINGTSLFSTTHPYYSILRGSQNVYNGGTNLVNVASGSDWWASSEYGSYYAWYVDFGLGYATSYRKFNTLVVRPVATF